MGIGGLLWEKDLIINGFIFWKVNRSVDVVLSDVWEWMKKKWERKSTLNIYINIYI